MSLIVICMKASHLVLARKHITLDGYKPCLQMVVLLSQEQVKSVTDF